MVEEIVDRLAKRGERRHRAGEIFLVDRGRGLGLGLVERGDQRFLLRQVGARLARRHFRDRFPDDRVVDQHQRVFLAGLRNALLFRRAHHLRPDPILFLQDVRRALVGVEQVGAVLGLDEAPAARSPAQAGARDRPLRPAQTPHRSDRAERRPRAAGPSAGREEVKDLDAVDRCRSPSLSVIAVIPARLRQRIREVPADS